MITWARHQRARLHCAVLRANDGGSVTTHCNGRWPVGETAESGGAVPGDMRCGGCLRALAAGAGDSARELGGEA